MLISSARPLHITPEAEKHFDRMNNRSLSSSETPSPPNGQTVHVSLGRNAKTAANNFIHSFTKKTTKRPASRESSVVKKARKSSPPVIIESIASSTVYGSPVTSPPMRPYPASAVLSDRVKAILKRESDRNPVIESTSPDIIILPTPPTTGAVPARSKSVTVPARTRSTHRNPVVDSDSTSPDIIILPTPPKSVTVPVQGKPVTVSVKPSPTVPTVIAPRIIPATVTPGYVPAPLSRSSLVPTTTVPTTSIPTVLARSLQSTVAPLYRNGRGTNTPHLMDPQVRNVVNIVDTYSEAPRHVTSSSPTRFSRHLLTAPPLSNYVRREGTVITPNTVTLATLTKQAAAGVLTMSSGFAINQPPIAEKIISLPPAQSSLSKRVRTPVSSKKGTPPPILLRQDLTPTVVPEQEKIPTVFPELKKVLKVTKSGRTPKSSPPTTVERPMTPVRKLAGRRVLNKLIQQNLLSVKASLVGKYRSKIEYAKKPILRRRAKETARVRFNL